MSGPIKFAAAAWRHPGHRGYLVLTVSGRFGWCPRKPRGLADLHPVGAGRITTPWRARGYAAKNGYTPLKGYPLTTAAPR